MYTNRRIKRIGLGMGQTDVWEWDKVMSGNGTKWCLGMGLSDVWKVSTESTMMCMLNYQLVRTYLVVVLIKGHLNIHPYEFTKMAMCV